EVVHAFDFRHGYLTNHHELRIADPKGKHVPGGLAVSPDGKTLAVCGTWGNAVTFLPLDDPDQRTQVLLGPLGKEIPGDRTGPTFRDNEGGPLPGRDVTDECFPYACLFEPGGRRLFVSLWNKAAVAVIDLAEKKVVATWPTERHPTELALRPDGRALYVACANSTKVSVIDPADGKP